ncbi:hypothetical protein EVAR_2514_1 [Eumeta japonica]|uniref:Uncharacterized protein n=1 Tax=Eumeta variegata TaxID=151549 RepID=A0A4C1SRI9_EUMVA|nr:hypothetical protein EVAR_2514_1 [Eumeta japonica]
MFFFKTRILVGTQWYRALTTSRRTDIETLLRETPNPYWARPANRHRFTARRARRGPRPAARAHGASAMIYSARRDNNDLLFYLFVERIFGRDDTDPNLFAIVNEAEPDPAPRPDP